MTHEYTGYTYKHEIADLALRLMLFVKKCKKIKRFSGTQKTLRKDFLKKNPSGTISQRPQSCIGIKCLLKWNSDLIFCNYDLIVCF